MNPFNDNRMNKKILLLLAFVAISHLINAQIWKDSNAKVEDRVEDLLSQMTLDEKIRNNFV